MYLKFLSFSSLGEIIAQTLLFLQLVGTITWIYWFCKIDDVDKERSIPKLPYYLLFQDLVASTSYLSNSTGSYRTLCLFQNETFPIMTNLNPHLHTLN